MALLRDHNLDQIINLLKKLPPLNVVAEGRLKARIEKLPAEDVADILERLDEKKRKKIIQILPAERATQVINSIDTGLRFSLLMDLPGGKRKEVLESMSSDEIVEIASELKREELATLLSFLSKKKATEARELLSYPKDSAGSMMFTDYIKISRKETPKEILNKIKKTDLHTAEFNILYVVDNNNRLIGIVSLRQLIQADENIPIEKLMARDFVSVNVDDDQEKVLRLMKKYNLLSIPVTDQKGHLEGVILFDDIYDIMEEEYTEDITKLAAISGTSTGEEELEMKVLASIKRRLPWLLILLFLYILTANVISRFSETIENMVFLAAFIPLIAAMAGNSATQSLALVIRGLALRDYKKEDVLKILKRDILVGAVIGIICGILISIVAAVWQQSFIVGFIVGFSLLVALTISTLTGAIIPLFFNYVIKVDPAVASGPFVTTINDIISLAIYFTIATLLIVHVI